MIRTPLLRALEFSALAGAALAAGNFLFPSDPFLLSANPHPLWLATLLPALRYGSPTGPLAGLGCALIHGLGLHLAGESLREAMHLGSWRAFAPFTYILVGFLVGEAITRRIKIGEFLSRQTLKARERLGAVEGKYAKLESAYRQLEGRLAGQTDTVSVLYASARQLDSDDREEIFNGLLAILASQLEAESAAVWTVGPDGVLRLVAWRGTEPPRNPPALALQAVRHETIQTASDFYQSAATGESAGACLLAGPLRGAREGVTAVATVAAMRFVGFVPARIKLFELLLDWTSRSLADAERLVEARRRLMDDEALDLASENYLRGQADTQFSLSRRQQTPLALLFCRPAADTPLMVLARLVLVLARIFKHLVRKSDTVAYFKQERGFVLLLPGVTSAGAQVVRQKLERAVGEFEFRPHGDDRPLVLEWSVVEPAADEDFSAALTRARKELKHD